MAKKGDIEAPVEIVKQGSQGRQARIQQMLGQLAYERLGLQKRIDKIDQSIGALEGARDENTMAQKDIATEEAIRNAKEEAKKNE